MLLEREFFIKTKAGVAREAAKLRSQYPALTFPEANAISVRDGLNGPCLELVIANKETPEIVKQIDKIVASSDRTKSHISGDLKLFGFSSIS